MRHLIRLSDYTKEEIRELFSIADQVKQGKYKGFLEGKTIVMFFPTSSIRTRVTFEKGIHLLGGQSILFPPESLDKKEAIEDVIGYLNNWADAVVVRNESIKLLELLRENASIPIINGMTAINHPCEMLADMYALSRLRENFCKDHFLFVGPKGNIGLAWKEAAELMGFHLKQSAPYGYEIEDVDVIYDLEEAIKGIDVVCTDSLSERQLNEFKNYQISLELMEKANKNVLLNPCPPFFRGEEVSRQVIDSSYFVGYEFKKCLLEIQQAILIFSLMEQ